MEKAVKDLIESMNNKLYCLYDGKEKPDGCFYVSKEQAEQYNSIGYAIYWTPNDLKPNIKDNKRIKPKAEDIERINYWYCDLDTKTPEQKKQAFESLFSIKLKPTMIVETKNGYHCYWKLKEPIIVEKFTDEVKNRFERVEQGIICNVMYPDKAVKNVDRILRAPGYYHLKDTNNPFLCKIIYIDDREITEKEMLDTFKIPEKPKKEYKKEFKKPDYRNIGTNKIERFLENQDRYFYNNTSKGNRNTNYFNWACIYRALNRPITEIKDTIETFNNSIDGISETELNRIIDSAYKEHRTLEPEQEQELYR